MLMLQPWVGLVSVAAACRRRRRGRGVAETRRRRPTVTTHRSPIVIRAESSPVFARLRRRYHLLLGGEVAALSVVGLAAVGGLTMRPVTDRQVERDVRNRDVMLCLDVSASMNGARRHRSERFATSPPGCAAIASG